VRIEGVELRPLTLVGLHLRGAHGRERQRVKREDDAVFAAEIRKTNLAPGVTREGEVRSRSSDGQNLYILVSGIRHWHWRCRATLTNA
jgi:hypothetical protein